MVGPAGTNEHSWWLEVRQALEPSDAATAQHSTAQYFAARQCPTSGAGCSRAISTVALCVRHARSGPERELREQPWHLCLLPLRAVVCTLKLHEATGCAGHTLQSWTRHVSGRCVTVVCAGGAARLQVAVVPHGLDDLEGRGAARTSSVSAQQDCTGTKAPAAQGRHSAGVGAMHLSSPVLISSMKSTLCGPTSISPAVGGV